MYIVTMLDDFKDFDKYKKTFLEMKKTIEFMD